MWIGVAVLLAPVAFVLTIAAFPFWRWLETAFGVESVGHSGPAEWCFLATYAGLVIVAALVVRLKAGKTVSER